MREALEEFLVVLAYSTKTQLAVIFGLAFFVGTMVAGVYFTSHLEIHGILAPLTDVEQRKQPTDAMEMFALSIGFSRHGFNCRFDLEPKLIVKESSNPRFGLACC